MTVAGTSRFIQVQVAVDDRAAGEAMCDAVVRERLAAAAQLLGPMRSSYWWQGELVVSEEWLCLLVLGADRYAELERRVVELHPYEVPEVIAFAIARASEPYVRWVETETGVRR